MRDMYLKGLSLALEDGCYIKVFCCSMHYPIVRVEKLNEETGTTELVAYAEHNNVLCALNDASNNIINEAENAPESGIICERTFLDDVIRTGYTLRFYKLNNGNILSSICTRGEKAIVIDCVISNSLESGIKDLNESLEMYYNDTYHFYKHAKEVVNNSPDILEYQKTIGSKDK